MDASFNGAVMFSKITFAISHESYGMMFTIYICVCYKTLKHQENVFDVFHTALNGELREVSGRAGKKQFIMSFFAAKNRSKSVTVIQF